MNYIFHAVHCWVGVCSNWFFIKDSERLKIFFNLHHGGLISVCYFFNVVYISLILIPIHHLYHDFCFPKEYSSLQAFEWMLSGCSCFDCMTRKNKGGFVGEREREKEQLKSAQCHCRLPNSNFRWNVSISLKFSGYWTCILWID